MGQTLAARMSRIDASGIRKVFDLAKSLKDPINLSIGQPDFDVPEPIKDAACEAIRSGKNTYTPTQGIAPLRALVQAEEERFTKRHYSDKEVLITSGVSGGLFLTLLALIEEGDEVIIPDPYFVMYKHLVSLLGATPVYLDTYASDFALDAQALEQVITPQTKLLLLNSPSNPTGRIMPEAEVRAIATVCEKHHLLVLSDEIYRGFAYEPMMSIAEIYEHTIVLGGHSKHYGMTGWRLGYAAGPEYIIQAMAMVQQYSFVCAPSVSQYAALACPQVDMTASIAAYQAKRDLMASILGQRFNVVSPDGAFYMFVEAPDGFTGDSFVERAIANNILIIPGSVFSEQSSHFRLCYTVPDQQLRAGAEALCRLADEQ